MNTYKENINKYLYGPSEEEIKDRLKKSNLGPDKLLKASIETGFIKGIKIALRHGADIHGMNRPPIIIAAEKGHLDVLKYLHDIGLKNTHYNDALHEAALSGHLDIVKYLVKNGADIHAEDDLALRWAMFFGQFDVVKYLVESGANVHVMDEMPLNTAVLRGYLDIVKYLIKKGANIDKINDKSIRQAYKQGHTDVIEYLNIISYNN